MGGIACRLITVAASVVLVGVFPMGASAASLEVPPGCRAAASLVDEGRLDDARDVAAALGATCKEAVDPLIDSAVGAAAGLVRRAKDTADEKEKARLAGLALALDKGNKEAAALVAGAAEAEPDDTLCAEAEQAAANGEFARAHAIFDGLKDVEGAKKCRTSGLADLAVLEQDDVATRLTQAATSDLLPTFAALALAFAFGVAIAAVKRVRVGLARVVAAAAVAGALLLVHGLLRMRADDPTESRWGTVSMMIILALLLATAAFGWLLSSNRRDAQALTIDVTGDTGDVAPRIISEMEGLGSSASAGTFAPKGTDVSDSGIEGALGTSANAIIKALLAVWQVVQLKASDRASVTVAGDEKAPKEAVVSLYKGRRLMAVRTVSGNDFCLDPASPTQEELAANARDLATGVAAAILMFWLGDGRVHDPERARSRLYGATLSASVALSAVGERRLSAENAIAAQELFRRAVQADNGNVAAKFGTIAALLRTYPGADETDQLLRELDRLEPLVRALEQDESPLPLHWRMHWLRAASRANGALVEQASFDAATLAAPDVVRQFRLARHALQPLLDQSSVEVPQEDRALFDSLRTNARAAEPGMDIVIAVPRPGREWVAPEARELMGSSLTDDHSVQFTIACTLSLLYAKARTAGLRSELAKACADRIRMAAGTQPGKEEFLSDPFLGFVRETPEFKKLAKEWKKVESPYDGVATFGELGAGIANYFPRPALLAAVVGDPARREWARILLGVGDETLQTWRGAAAWLARGQPPARINLYQAAGFVDAQAVRRVPVQEVERRLTALARLGGTTDIPDEAARAEMRA